MAILGYDGQGKSTLLFNQFIQYKRLEMSEKDAIYQVGCAVKPFFINLPNILSQK